MTGRRTILLTAAVGIAIASPSPAALSPDEAHRTLNDATERFRAGASLVESDRPAAERELDAAIAHFRRLIEEGGIRNGPLYYNLGNAYFLAGDLGRAVLSYRRAALLAPRDENLQANLAHARQRVPNRIDAPAQESVRRTLLFWHDETPAAARFKVFQLAFIAAWALALLRLAGARRLAPRWMIGACAAVAAATLASLMAERRAAADAVVVAPQTVGRKGPDRAAYEPSFTEPLHAGVEVRIEEHRPGWVLARLGDGRRTWLEASAVEPVRETPRASGAPAL